MYLMNGGAVSLIHLVKLVNTTDALVSQYQSTALQHLRRHWFVIYLGCSALLGIILPGARLYSNERDYRS